MTLSTQGHPYTGCISWRDMLN